MDEKANKSKIIENNEISYSPETLINEIKGIGPVIEQKLKEAGIKTCKDLLFYFPFRFEDLSNLDQIENIEEEDIKNKKKIVFKGKFTKPTTIRTRTGKQMVLSKFDDGTGKIQCVWFNTTYIIKSIKLNQTYLITGSIGKFGKYPSITNPNIEVSNTEKENVNIGRIVPVYTSPNGVSIKTVRKLILEVLNNIKIEDFLEEENSNLDLLNLEKTLNYLHFPQKNEDIKKAKDRIALNEIIHTQLHGLKVKETTSKSKSSFIIKKDFSNLIKLPFELTKDQEKAVKKINSKLHLPNPLNALISGDVGSGKTIVAILTAFNVIKNGGKVIYLAPTVVLAEQVYKEFMHYYEPFKKEIKIGKYTAKEKDNIEEVEILIGTHALLNIEDIGKKANYIIVDEQHKFGVKQRAKLIEATSKKLKIPHVVTMTATPIPRTLALTFFSELELLPIKTKPKGRIPVKTKLVPGAKRKDLFKWIKKENKKTYWVVPFIKKSESEIFKDVKNIEETEKILNKEFKEDLLILHGKMKNEEKNNVIKEFKKRKFAVLLSTQVIEVGVDVKDAEIIIIESSERFGLAALHQLRGRVGRNDKECWCFLFTSTKESENSKRLKLLEKVSNGFELAKKDLDLRGSGQIFGLKQSGELDLKFVDFSNEKLIEEAQEIAKTLFINKKQLKKYLDNPFTRDLLMIKDN